MIILPSDMNPTINAQAKLASTSKELASTKGIKEKK